MSPEQEGVASFQFVNLTVAKAVYELVGAITPAIERPAKGEVGLEVGAGVQLPSDGRTAFVRLEVKVAPDQRLQPYRLEVTVIGVFTSQDATQDQILKFCQVAAPSILFPYIRETIHRLTMDAPNGTVRLDPVNISAMLNQSEWEVSRPEATPTASNEPTQPSEQ